jgi:hypothetical protein
MTETGTRSAEVPDPFKELIQLASDQTAQTARERAAIKAPTVRVSRKRATLVGLVISAPIFATLLVINVWGISLVDMLTPAPAPEIAREQTHSALDEIVDGIESFRHDYDALPERLIEVGVPARGSWAYSRIADDRYQVVGEMYGVVVTFDSSERKAVREPHQ